MKNATTIDSVYNHVSHVPGLDQKDKRGINVYSYSQLTGVTGKTKRGNWITGTVENPIFTLTIADRINVFRSCADVFGIVTSRMNRFAGLNYRVTTEKEDEDEIIAELDAFKQIYDEYKSLNTLESRVIQAKMKTNIKNLLIEILPDLSNYERAKVRWRKRIKNLKIEKTSEIEDWLAKPNQYTDWSSFVKKYVFDLLIHGAIGIYKEMNLEKQLENMYILPGGSIYPLRNIFVGGDYNAYAQIIDGLQPQIFFQDEIAFNSYIPTSAFSYGMIPLDALVNKVAEKLLFDKLMAEQADGTKPPEKLVVFGDTAPFGDLNSDIDLAMPKEEQKRIETKLNETKKVAIATLSGHGRPLVLDLTRENTMAIQLERQKEIKKDIALVFNMTNMEINESGGDSTSGRATSESQERIEKSKGIKPIIQNIENSITNNVLPFRYGPGYRLKLESEIDESEKIQKLKEKYESGLYGLNEIRIKDLNESPFDGDEYQKPSGQKQIRGL